MEIKTQDNCEICFIVENVSGRRKKEFILKLKDFIETLKFYRSNNYYLLAHGLPLMFYIKEFYI